VLVAFNKPYGVLSQFTPDASVHRTLAQFNFPASIYPIGRLDADSEGLLLLSDEPELNARLLHPHHGHQRIYWVQVERIPEAATLKALSGGLVVRGRQSLPCRAWLHERQPDLWPRDPPIRFRKSVPTCWIGLELTEGKNRQIRRMTAAVGHPTLRLVRMQIGSYALDGLRPGCWKAMTQAEREAVFA